MMIVCFASVGNNKIYGYGYGYGYGLYMQSHKSNQIKE